jgi:hypothetical protein
VCFPNESSNVAALIPTCLLAALVGLYGFRTISQHSNTRGSSLLLLQGELQFLSYRATQCSTPQCNTRFWSNAGHVVYAMSFLMFACMMTDAMVPPL